MEMGSPDGVNDGEWLLSLQVNGSIVGDTLLSTHISCEMGSSSPLWGQYVNSWTSLVTITVLAKQVHTANQTLASKDLGTCGNVTWLEVTEVKR